MKSLFSHLVLYKTYFKVLHRRPILLFVCPLLLAWCMSITTAYLATMPPTKMLVDCASCMQGNDGTLCANCGRHQETVVVAWECGSCSKTNEDMSRRHCHICGQQRPLRYLIVGAPIEPDCGGRRWFGKCAEPIDAEDNKVSGDGNTVKHDGDGYGQSSDKK